MSKDWDPDDYEVGYGRPPKDHQFRKGRSGNPKGRPKTKVKGKADITGLLEAPVKATVKGKTEDRTPFEVTTRQMVKKALRGDISAILKFIARCEKYGLLAPPPPDTGGGVIHAPPGVTCEEWLAQVAEVIPEDEL